jgi:hypothetical protein
MENRRRKENEKGIDTRTEKWRKDSRIFNAREESRIITI